MRQDPSNLRQLLERTVESMGYELVGVEFHPHRSNALLRVYIDRETGITVDDCQRVSHQISGLLDVEDPIPGQYSLEVSSPGLDRPLFTAEHFARFAGQQARLNLSTPLAGRRRLTGRLGGLRGEAVIIAVEGETLEVPLNQIDKARLVPEF
ncbi:MAG: ribosome maturation factor RimP [Candidatus Competibacteraceae bacterium]|nr:ribosome maturation factor RimP [Candidatus Competibacteraceae bacterium]